MILFSAFSSHTHFVNIALHALILLLKVVGWGQTENMVVSSVLLEANIPYIDHRTCRNMYQNGFQIFVTVDKFCAGTKSGE